MTGQSVLSVVQDNELESCLGFEQEVAIENKYDCPYADLCRAFVCIGLYNHVGDFDLPPCFVGHED